MIVYHYMDKPVRVGLRFLLSYFIFNVIFIAFFFLLKELRVPKFTVKGRMVQVYTNFYFHFSSLGQSTWSGWDLIDLLGITA